MPAQPDRDTLHLRAPDRRTPAEAAALVRRVLARPPAASFADVGLAPPDRALVSLHGRYPGVEAHYPEPVRWGGRPRASPPAPRAGPEAVRVVHGPGPGSAPRPAAPRVDAYSRELLGDPCPTCAAIVNPKPKPKPQPRAKPGRAASHARIRAARAGVAAGQRRPLPAARASTRTSRPRRRPTPGELAAATSAGLTAGAIAYNRSRVDPLGIPRQRAAHLTGGTVW